MVVGASILTLRLETENEIVGEALVALLHEDLKYMGITSVGHRLTILKSVYDIKKTQDVPIEHDHYVPLCKSGPLVPMTACPRSTYAVLTALSQLPMPKLSTPPQP